MAVAMPTAVKGVPMVEVSAPSDLPGGYVFDAVANGQTFSVTVPAGGVSRGQTFSAPFVPGGGGVSASVPEGRWKDDLCDCCMFGCCHPALWMGICCRLALLGQVQNRLRLNWLGERANPGDQSPFKVLLGISIFAMVWSQLFSSLLKGYIDPSTGLPIEGSPYWAIYAVNLAFSCAVGIFFDLCHSQDPPIHPRAQRNPREELPGVRGLLLRLLVWVLHAHTDG